MAVVPEDTWNLACWGCRDPGHSLFTYPYLTTAQRIFFAYRYFRHHAEANPLVAKWYLEKAKHRAGDGPNPGRKPRPKSPARTGGQPHAPPVPTPVNAIADLQPESDAEDTSEDDGTPKKA